MQWSEHPRDALSGDGTKVTIANADNTRDVGKPVDASLYVDGELTNVHRNLSCTP